jgi:RNA polymerase sigma factor (sigma-70 family)
MATVDEQSTSAWSSDQSVAMSNESNQNPEAAIDAKAQQQYSLRRVSIILGESVKHVRSACDALSINKDYGRREYTISSEEVGLIKQHLRAGNRKKGGGEEQLKEIVQMGPVDQDFVVEQVFTARQLAERFNVSTKTIGRWSDHGLVGRNMTIDGRKKNCFLKSTVDQFIARNAERINRAAAFSQLSDDDRSDIIEHACALVQSGGSRHAVTHIADSMKRSQETVRRVIKQHDAAHPESPVFTQPANSPSEKVKDRASQDRRRRVQRIQELSLGYMHSPEFSESGKESAIIAPMPPSEDCPRKNRAPNGLPPYLASLYDTPLLTAEQEIHQFRKYNYAKCRATALRDQFDPEKPSERLMKKIEQMHRVAVETRNQILLANLRLVVSVAKKIRSPASEFFALVSDGNMTLRKAIEKFDYTRGNKFSTYASWALRRNFSTAYAREKKREGRFQNSHKGVLESSLDYRTNATQQMSEQRQHEKNVHNLLDCLNDREKKIISSRFGLAHSSEPQTLAKIGEKMDLTKERIRQIEARAMRKLRAAAEESMAPDGGVERPSSPSSNANQSSIVKIYEVAELLKISEEEVFSSLPVVKSERGFVGVYIGDMEDYVRRRNQQSA